MAANQSDTSVVGEPTMVSGQKIVAPNAETTREGILPGPHAQFSGQAKTGVDDNTATQLAVRDVEKSYTKGQNLIPVLRRVNLDIHLGEFVSIVGQSGSGKSTLVHLMGTLDRPDAGEIWLDDQRIDNVSAKRRDALRNEFFGMIFQSYHLLPELTAVGNVLAPLMIGRSTWNYLRHHKELRRQAVQLLETVGLGHRLHHKPNELSGGEMQRTAIARALINRPRVLLADEPTGNLDNKTGWEILELLRSLNAQQNLTIVMVTHDDKIASQADRSVRLVEGRVERA